MARRRRRKLTLKENLQYYIRTDEDYISRKRLNFQNTIIEKIKNE
jgi:hypothetical protein